MTTTLRNWHWTRWLRLGVAAAFVGQGFASGDAVAYAFGAFFGIQAIFNIGCYTGGSCATTTTDNTATKQDITYQEIQ